MTKPTLRKSVLPAIIILQSIAIAILVWFVYWNWLAVGNVSNDKLQTLVVQSVDALLKPVNVDAQTGKVYVYESRLVFPPAPDGSYDMMYYINPGYKDNRYDQNVKAELHLINRFAYSAAKSKVFGAQGLSQVMDAIPKLQACAGGYLVVFSPIIQYQTEWKPVFDKKLKDGRTAYVFQKDLCSQNNKHMVPYLKQIDSY